MTVDNRILVIAGLSAAGKTVVSREVISRGLGFTTIRSVTTRSPRGDGHDSEYIYLSEAELLSMWERGELVEYMTYAGHMYGTPRSELDRAHSEGLIPLLVLDLSGAAAFSSTTGYSTCAVYLYEDINTVEERLYARYLGDSPTPEGLARFVSRKERNLADAASLPDIADVFYAFIKNGASVVESADRVLDAFRAFSEGTPPDRAESLAVAEQLAAAARAKLSPDQL